MSIINELLEGKRSNAVKMFFCGEYFVGMVETHPLFSQLQELVWDAQKASYESLSKKVKALKTLTLKTRVSSFFSTSEIVKNKTQIEALQRQILNNWGNYDGYFGISINWHEVFMSAMAHGALTKTQEDYDALVSLQDIPNY